MPLSRPAEHTVTAVDVPFGRNDIAGRVARDFAPDLDDLARELVSDDERRLEPSLGP